MLEAAPEAMSPNTVTVMIPSLSDQGQAREANFSHPDQSPEASLSSQVQQNNHLLLFIDPQQPEAAVKQNSDHPLLSTSPSSRRNRTASSSSLTGLADFPHSGSNGSLSGVSLPPLGRSGSGRRLVVPPAGPPKSRLHRKVHSLSSADDSEVVRIKKANAERSLEELFTKLEKCRRQYGNCHPRVGLVHNLIGNYYFRKGNLATASKSYENSLECFKNMGYNGDCPSENGDSCSSLASFGSNSALPDELQQQLDIACALGNIGAVLWSTGKLPDAIESLDKSIEIRRHVGVIKARDGVKPSEKEVADMSSALYSLGLAHSLRGDYDEAMDCLNQAEEELTKCTPPVGSVESARSIEVARIDDARGKVHLLRGDASSSLECHRHALEAKSTALESSHPSILATRVNMAAAHRAMGNIDQALSLCHDILSAQKVALYRERDAEAKARATADMEATTRIIGELQMQVASTRRGSGSKDLMAAIVEENQVAQ